jgi:RimJ/RimL family protein N-acetyltransferase
LNIGSEREDGAPYLPVLSVSFMPTILTRRLILRPLRESDLVPLASEINNPRIANNLSRVPWPYRLDDARAFYDQTRNSQAQTAVFALALRPRDEPLIGLSGYETHGEETELGYWLAEERWGQGIMREAASAVVDHAFAISRLERLQSCCFLGNEVSRRLLLNLGFRPTFTGRTHVPLRGRMILVQNFELGAKEWRLLHTTSARSKTPPA